jgi:CheY-like chemotaxis protein
MRILIVEDNLERERQLCSWLPSGVKPVVATSAGRAIGILARDNGKVYGAIVLDHDLQQRCATDSDSFLSGQDVVDAIVRNVSREVPILVHSVNASQGPVMARRLLRAGYDVTQIPMDQLTSEAFSKWLQEAQDGSGDRAGPS